MGYGPADKNRFGWCYRNEHGSGVRMTPYFETEEIVEDFHNYCDKHTKELQEYIGVFGSKNIDLRLTKLKNVNNLANKYSKEKNVKVLISPEGETIKEFYGIDQMTYVGYEDPTPFPWEIEE